jgi:5-oxoprolinase (ATP-hydrolysing)
MSARGWQFWIDRGGTFTDILARHPDGRLTSRKLLSDNPGQYQDAAVAGILSVLADSSVKPHIEAIKMGTTVATNALLERRGEPTALLITAGFKDALRIAYQDRPDLFALDIRRPEMLYQEVLAVEERLAADGRCLQALNQEQLRSDLEAAYARGLRAVSICFLHAYRYPRHEQIAAEIAAETGFTQVSVSHLTSPLIKFISRADTTLADAYLSPVLQAYIEKLQAALTVAGVQAERLLFMQSNGGLVAPTDFQGKDSVLSGPAGGVVGMVSACAGIGEQRLIGFDMGGTSTDVSLYAGEFERVTETEIAGVRLRAPMIRIHTIAAGGGSILKFSAGRFQVGPESAGAQPGPRCYRNDGPLTVTDANLILGRLNATNFPAVFGPAGDQGPDAEAAQAGFEALAKKISQTSGKHWSPESVAEGFIRVAVDNMANAIKTVSIQRGYDPADFTLCCFGGAAGQQACRVADALGLQRVVIHPLAGLLSAYGIGMATLSSYAQASLDVALTETQVDILKAMREKLASEGQAKLSGQGIRQADMRVETTLAVRLEGTDTSLAIDWQDSLAETADAFRAAHLRRFGFAGSEDELRVDSMRVTVVGAQLDNATALPSAPTNTRQTPQQTRLFVDGRWASAELWQREQLSVETLLRGPALIVDETNTVVLEPGWQLQLDDQHRLVLTRCEQSTEAVISADADPVLLEVFNNHFVNIAEQMGAVLENTAHSVNIK